MTLSRVLGAGLLLIAAVLVAIVLIGGEEKHTYKAVFETAGQLVVDNDVQIGGRRIGRVSKIELTDNNQAEIDFEVEDPYGPLHEGTTAIVRATSLSGVANRYISLTPGPDSAPELEDGTTIGVDSTTSIVDLDQLFNTLDEKTSTGLAEVIQGFGTWYAGRGEDANEAAQYLSPALSSTRRLIEKLNADQPALEQLITETSKAVSVLAARGGTLTDLVSNTNTTMAAIADENASLGQALDLLPQTLRRGSTTFVNLRAALGDLDQLVAASKVQTKNLAPFLADLRPLLRDSQPTVAQLAKLARQPGASNDLTDLLNDSPQLAKTAGPAFDNSSQALKDSLPVLTFIRPYSPELVGWFRDFGVGAANYDANGHYARVAPVFNAFKYDPVANNLVPVPPEDRTPGLENGAQIVNRCPGAAIQPPADGSAPWRDVSGTLDCNPAIVPPGP
jgi:phospholipid/cholesterol/gamma-HCH transport system substrate-binding protein